MSDKGIKYDEEYLSYLNNGESAVVYITRDIVKSIDTSNKWIDVIDHDGEKNWDSQWKFNYIVVELFPRKKKPQYPKGADDSEKRYLTWKTAHDDIDEQRSAGVSGEEFRIEVKLVNKNKRGSWVTWTEKRIWDEEKQHWVMDGKITPSCKEKNLRFKEFVRKEPKWRYIILGIKRIEPEKKKSVKHKK